jgi:hypothetical protein
MVEMACRLRETHAHALEHLIKRLDFQAIRGYARSEQESYDILFCLESLRKALERRGDHATPVGDHAAPGE